MIDGRIFDGIMYWICFLLVLVVVFVPLGLWKLIELIILVCSSLNISWGG